MIGYLFAATIPYDTPHAITQQSVQRGTLRVPRDRAGQPRLPVLTSNDRSDPVGRTVSAELTDAGLAVVVDLGSRRGRTIGYDLGGYYLTPVFAAGRHLVALDVSALASWNESELVPAGTASSSPPRAPSPLPPRPAVNLTPLRPIR